jgi:hypothetical protein
LGDTLLSTQYPSLYNITRHNDVLVVDVTSYVPLNIGFTRALTHDKWEAWIDLVPRFMDVSLKDEPDKFVWRLTTSGIFFVKLCCSSFELSYNFQKKNTFG